MQIKCLMQGFFALVFVRSISVHAQHLYPLDTVEMIKSGGVEIVVESYSVPSLGDFDADGRPDLIVGEATGLDNLGKVRIYRNVGTTDVPHFTGYVFAQTASGVLTVPRISCMGAFPRFVDWDKDGKGDLLIGLANGTIKIFLNVGTAQSPVFDNGTDLTVGPAGSKVTLNVGARATPSLVDWNNDGRRDLIVGEMDGYINLFLNHGTDAAPDYLQGQLIQANGVNLDVGTRSSPVVVDIDGDHRKDLLVGDTEGKLYFYRNMGADASPVFDVATNLTAGGTVIDLAATRARPFVCDYNHDGRLDILVGASDGKVYLFTSMTAIPLGGQRLAEVQNIDGGWDWPVDDGDALAGSQSDTLGTIGLGLAHAYQQTRNPDLLESLARAGTLLLTKTDDFYANEGAFAKVLDSIFQTTIFSTHVRSSFYDKLAAGTYYDAISDTADMTTAMYIQTKLDRYEGGQANAAAWDLGLSLYDAQCVGADTAPWLAAVKTEIDKLDNVLGYDVLGLAGAVFGLAMAGQDYDPQAGAYASASNLADLAEILSGYQLQTGGFTFSSQFMEEGMDNETLQETAYATLALNAVNRERFWPTIQMATSYMAAVQLFTGGWENYNGDPIGEDNLITSECVWSIQSGLSRPGDLEPNGRVDGVDFAILSANWMRSDCGSCSNADITGDGTVDIADLLLLAENWMSK